MKKLAVILAAAIAVALTGCGTDSKSPLISYVARAQSDSIPHLFTLNGTASTTTPTAVAIPIPATAYYIAVNPTATQVAYYRNDDAGYDLFLMGKDGTEKPLTTDGHAWSPAFSPNGKVIAYSDYASGNDDQIFTVNVDGSNAKVLYAPGANTADAYYATFSPDGKSLVFFIYVYNNGPFAQPSRPGTSSSSGPQPRNRQSNGAVHSSIKPQVSGLTTSGWYTMALTDTTPTLVYATNNNWGPAVYSGDGKKILFTGHASTQWNISSVNLDGTGITALTTSTTTESFSPVVFKNQIVFNQYNSTNSSWDIYVMDQTGANQTLVGGTANTYDSLNDAYWGD